MLKHLLIPLKTDLLKLGVPEHLCGPFAQQQFRLSFGVSSWYSKLEPFTIPSQFVWLTENEVDALLAHSSSAPQPPEPVAEAKSISGLEAKLDAAISQYPGGAFIKLDSRSPKDAVVSRDGDAAVQRCVIDSISQQCRQRRDSSSSPVAAATASASISPEKESTSAKKLQVTSQEALNGFMTALALASKVTSGKEAVALLCDSWRVREDLQSVRHFMQYGMKICLVVRHWNQMLAENPQREFRGFVCHNQLTALSQYDHKCYFAEVFEAQDRIASTAQRFFDSVLKDALSAFDSYVIDLYLGDGDDEKQQKQQAPPAEAAAAAEADGKQSRNSSSSKFGKAMIVELNSFESWTGACLFSWSRDQQRLLNGPFELRVVPPPSSSSSVSPSAAVDVDPSEMDNESLFDMIPPVWQRFILSHFDIIDYVPASPVAAASAAPSSSSSSAASSSSSDCSVL